MKPITANPSQIMVEQLAASGLKYVFYNSGSREARFFDALHVHPDIDGILALHEGSVTSMAGGYTQVGLDPAVMVVHLGAGLAQCLGQLINVWSGSLPVVVITFAGDTGSYGDKVGLDLSHNVGPTSIAEPFTKACWTVIEPGGLPQAIYRALLIARTPPVGPVHLAVYDRLLDDQQVSTQLIEGAIPMLRAGYPDDADVEVIARALHDAKRPLIYAGDGIWKSGSEAGLVSFAEQYGIPIAGNWAEMRRVPKDNALLCGRIDEAVAEIEPDLVLCTGVRLGGRGKPQDFGSLSGADRLIAVGSDGENLKNIPGLDLGVLADEGRTLARLEAQTKADRFADRRTRAQAQAQTLRERRLKTARRPKPVEGRVRPWVLADHLDRALARAGGGHVMVEQYAVTLDGVAEPAPENVYLRAAGGSEGYGVGGAVGVKLAAPEKPVVGLVGDGSLYYADSGMWTAVHHGIPLLYVISNNESYGIVSGAFSRAEGEMKKSGAYAGVALEGIDPVKIADGFGVEGDRVTEEGGLEAALDAGLNTVTKEQRPYLLDVRLPSGLPEGGRGAAPYKLV